MSTVGETEFISAGVASYSQTPTTIVRSLEERGWRCRRFFIRSASPLCGDATTGLNQLSLEFDGLDLTIGLAQLEDDALTGLSANAAGPSVEGTGAFAIDGQDDRSWGDLSLSRSVGQHVAHVDALWVGTDENSDATEGFGLRHALTVDEPTLLRHQRLLTDGDGSRQRTEHDDQAQAQPFGYAPAIEGFIGIEGTLGAPRGHVVVSIWRTESEGRALRSGRIRRETRAGARASTHCGGVIVSHSVPARQRVCEEQVSDLCGDCAGTGRCGAGSSNERLASRALGRGTSAAIFVVVVPPGRELTRGCGRGTEWGTSPGLEGREIAARDVR